MQPTLLEVETTHPPSITLPAGFRFGTPSTISAGTHSIKISARGVDEINICGTVEALTHFRLIQLEWLPGAPGNNSTSQTVLFGKAGPVLFRGNPTGQKFQEPLIRIMRQGSRRYNIRLPATEEQKHLLEKLRKDEQAQWGAEEPKPPTDRTEAASASAPRHEQLKILEALEKMLLEARQESDLKERGLRKDPGMPTALREAGDGGDTKFQVGDIALCYGDDVIITGEYSYRRVLSDDGPLIGNDGRRLFYAWGYAARSLSNGNEYYYAAHALQHPNGAIKYLKLVSSR